MSLIAQFAQQYQELRPTKEQESYAKKLKTKDNEYNDLTRNTNTFEKYYGYLGEVVVCDLVGKPRPKGKFDGGFDFVINNVFYDVKTSTCFVKPHNNCHVTILKDNVSSLVGLRYIFLLYNPKENVFYLVGSLQKEVFLSMADFYGSGERTNNYLVAANCEQYRLKVGSLDFCEIKKGVVNYGSYYTRD